MTIWTVVFSVVSTVSLLMHFLGTKHPSFGKIADGIDKVEDLAKTVAPKA